MTTILVTGATGTVAGEVVRALEGRAGVTVRAAVRSAAKGGALRRANITPVDFDFGKPETVEVALAGADMVFLCTPFVGRRHREVEKHIEASGLAYTFLRPNNFMENFLNYYPPAPDGNIYLPWGEGACSFIAAGDIGRVAAVALTTPGHENRAYTLTGPTAFTIGEAARAIAEVSGRAVRYVDVPESAARKAMLDLHMPEWMVDGMMELHAIDKAGYAAAVNDAVREITGQAAVAFPAFAAAHAARWKG
jgi:uncharacterized protein YbjT (DUF2867 family)